MKVFGCKVQQEYAGGIILVAANNIDEAFRVAAESHPTSWVFHYEDSDGNWVDKDEIPDAICVSSYYPIECWEEYPHLTSDLTEPQTILEESFGD